MNPRFIIILLIIILGCRSKTPSEIRLFGTTDTTIFLKDSLGLIKLTVPIRYDTFMQWTQYSDCGSCGTERYRFQVKTAPVFLESGFFWDHLEDSVDQLTIIHQQRLRKKDSTDDNFIKVRHKSFREEVDAELWSPKNSLVFDTLQIVGGKWNSLLTTEHYDSSSYLYSKAVAGRMLISGKPIMIIFSLLTKNRDSTNTEFIEKSKKMMLRIFEQNGI